MTAEPRKDQYVTFSQDDDVLAASLRNNNNLRRDIHELDLEQIEEGTDEHQTSTACKPTDSATESANQLTVFKDNAFERHLAMQKKQEENH